MVAPSSRHLVREREGVWIATTVSDSHEPLIREAKVFVVAAISTHDDSSIDA